MADEMPRADEVTNLTPQEVAEGVRAGTMLLVDVREPNETAAEQYPSAVLVPLSSFDPTAIPDPQGKRVAGNQAFDRLKCHLSLLVGTFD